jgi:N-acetylglucosamine malate deacetylase 2
MIELIEQRRGAAILDALPRRGTISSKIGIIAAHPDDETIAMGAQLSRFSNAVLLHTTDGAPRDGHDSWVHGFGTTVDYAAARRNELAAALMAGEADRIRCETLGMADQASWLAMAELARSIAVWLKKERPAAVFVQPYEGGHPDHDAVAFAVYAGCRLNEMNEDWVPAVIEMASYYAAGNSRATASFLPGPGVVVRLNLSAAERRRKRLMLDCFVTQRETLVGFETETEQFRFAPTYDFTQPPHAGKLYYERYDWGISGAMWRSHAAAALAELRLGQRR